ncbi:MAG: DUF6950 family protein [Sphingopyxis sp.]
MTGSRLNLAQRAAATQATWALLSGVPFAWDGMTCVDALHAQMLHMGHQPPAVPGFRTKAGARRALKAMGATSLGHLMEDVLGLERIAPAAMIVGDVALIPGDGVRTDGIRGAIAICAGNKFMGWHGAAEGFQMIDDVMPHVKAAFRL